jgi:glycyl-tRNA synthetase beta chain
VREFQALPEALALAAANKRIGNILKKADARHLPEPDVALLEEAAEKALFERVRLIAPLVKSHVANEDYADALKVLASVRSRGRPFLRRSDGQRSMNPLLRGNRLGLLKALFDQLNAVADISKLAV